MPKFVNIYNSNNKQQSNYIVKNIPVCSLAHMSAQMLLVFYGV